MRSAFILIAAVPDVQACIDQDIKGKRLLVAGLGNNLIGAWKIVRGHHRAQEVGSWIIVQSRGVLPKLRISIIGLDDGASPLQTGFRGMRAARLLRGRGCVSAGRYGVRQKISPTHQRMTVSFSSRDTASAHQACFDTNVPPAPSLLIFLQDVPEKRALG
jgi:hypothetical protein